MAPVRKDVSKPSGKKSAYAFFVQYYRDEQKKKFPESKIEFAKLSAQCSKVWGDLNDDQKAYFQNLAAKDKERYESEMMSYVPPVGIGGKEKKKKLQKKDPNAPKRPISGFFWFCNDERPKVRGKFPEYGIGEVAKELGRRWASLDAETKNRYDLMAKKDKERYLGEMAAYTNGN